MDDDIEHILNNSSKAELLEAINEELPNFDKAIVILIKDKDNGTYNSLLIHLGITSAYEAYGILEVARQDLQNEEDSNLV